MRSLVRGFAIVFFVQAAGLVNADEPDDSAQMANRIDFGNAYVSGQTIKSGAVYLMHRKQNEIESMLKPRQDYRAEILEGFSVSEKVDQVSKKVIDVSSKN